MTTVAKETVKAKNIEIVPSLKQEHKVIGNGNILLHIDCPVWDERGRLGEIIANLIDNDCAEITIKIENSRVLWSKEEGR